MITNEVMSPLADQAAARYGMLVDAWNGIFKEALGRADLGSARSFSRVALDAYGLAQVFIASENERNAEALKNIALAAFTATTESYGANVTSALPDAASEALSAAIEHLRLEIAVQIERDVAFLVQSLRRQALQVVIAARSQRLPMVTAILQNRIGAGENLKFLFLDRSGARWSSRKYVRTAERLAMLNLYNDVSILTIAEHGDTEAAIQHLNPEAEVHEMRLAMSPNGTLPTYTEIRADIFHPNADAIVVPVGGL